ncbi:MAG: DUF4350 domain-containing protein [Verrucomicrobiota bacterium]
MVWNLSASGLRASPTVLFVRGGDGTGGFLEGGGNDQLADITDYSTGGGNHGWGELADWLRENDFVLEQRAEGPVSDNTPVPFADLDLEEFDVIVLGSNNADYEPRHVDALIGWIEAGGGLLVISDANFGRNWGDAPDSDQLFLDRLGWVMNQDQGTYSVNRSSGDYPVPDHPVLEGVDSFDGEGVSPIMVGSDPVPGVTTTLLARAKGTTRINNRYSQGSSRQTTSADGALVVAETGEGRVVGHFDRNTFFNRNGAGTDLHRLDNRTYALNLFRWLAFGDSGLEISSVVPEDRNLTLSSSEDEVTFAASATLFGKGLSIFNPPRFQWSLLEGPGDVTFSNDVGARTMVRFSAPGLYQLRLAATHGLRETEQVLSVLVRFGPGDLLQEAFGQSEPVVNLVRITEGGQRRFELNVARTEADGFDFILEQSTDLVEWVASNEDPDLTEKGILRFRILEGDSVGFLRVRVGAK